MRYFSILIVFFCISLPLASQPSTEIYLMDLAVEADTMRISGILNISNNEGYDNQPSFYDDKTILFASTRNNQTDIALFTISDSTTTWISNTTTGSEYSPLKIPGKAAVSAIRLDTDGLQRLYEYDIKTGTSTELLKDLKVGYHVWYNDHIIVSSVLIENRMNLVVSNLTDGTNYTVQKNVGRSLHKIPNTDLISFVSKEITTPKLKSLHPITGATKDIITLLDKSEDVCWTADGTLISSYDKVLFTYKPLKNKAWETAFIFKEKEILGISRMAVSPNNTQFVLVSKDAPDKIVQKQVESFNSRNLEAFVGCYATDVLVTNFPSDTLYLSREKMRENYRKFYERTPSIEVKVANRINIGSTVIDQEVVTINDQQKLQVAIYEIDGLITSMRFIRAEKVDEDPETIVQKQLDAYNARDIEGFLATYTDDIKLYNFPNTLSTDGLAAMREGYTGLFESTPDLHADISNRIVIGNTVIDKEEVTANGYEFSAVAIYEVEKGKISKVTFVR